MNIRKIFDFFKKYLTNSDYRFLIHINSKKYKYMEDEEYLGRVFKAELGYPLNLKDPHTFNEKLQWLKINDRKPIYTIMADKYEVRSFIAERIGSEYLVPLIGVWENPEDIDFDSLPNQFVLKCNHNSGLGMYICEDKSTLNKRQVIRNLKKGLRQDYYQHGREWPYKNIPRKVICEQYLKDGEEKGIKDYKFFCFDGKVEFFKIDLDRFVCHRANYYDTNGCILEFGEAAYPPDYNREVELPINLEKMKSLAKILSAGIPFLRVDFYEVSGKIYFGELTFFPASGFGKFIPSEYDSILGEEIHILK